jgi:hypothetical protein
MAAALVAACSTAQAQELPLTRGAAPQGAPVAVASAPQAAASREDIRADIRAMESLLTNALQKGAQDLALRMQANAPGSRFVTGTGRARGFALEGYGVFFDVDVPGMKQSLVWSAEMLRQIQYAESLRQFIATHADSPERRLAEMDLARYERQMNSVRPPQPQSAPRGEARATVVGESTTATEPPPSASAARTAPAADLRDPNELYTDAVKNALIDAMLKYSGFLKIGAEEWLTVAARDSEGPSMPGQIEEASTIVLRVKGSDLAAFQAGKLTREEVLHRVVVKEF